MHCCTHFAHLQYRNQILYLVENYRTVVIVGETGSGKTTQVCTYSVWVAVLLMAYKEIKSVSQYLQWSLQTSFTFSGRQKYKFNSRFLN